MADTLKKRPVYITHSLTLYEDAFIIILMRKGVLIPRSSSATPANTNYVISI